MVKGAGSSISPRKPTTVTEAFSVVLKERRIELKLTQDDIAAASDVDRTHISLLERGKRQPSLSVAILIAEALKMEPDELIREVIRRMRD